MMTAASMGLPADMLVYDSPQGSDEWLAERCGVITGSMVKVALSRLAGTKAKEARFHKTTGALLAEATPAVRGDWSAASVLYAMNVARELVGGKAASKFSTHAMRFGQAVEDDARLAYEVRTGRFVEPVGFVCTFDHKYGCSSDGLMLHEADGRGAVEIKAMVSSDTLFTAMVYGDISEFVHQCHFEIWMLHLDWIDLVLYAPDLEGDAALKIIRIERDDDFITQMLEDLTEFDGQVQKYAADLRAMVAGEALQPHWEEPPPAATTTPPAASPAPVALLADIF